MTFFSSRKQKIKVDRSKIKEMCGVKKSCFEILVTDMEKLADTIQGKYEPLHKKNPFQGFSQGLTLSGLYSHKMARGLKFPIYKAERLYYL